MSVADFLSMFVIIALLGLSWAASRIGRYPFQPPGDDKYR
jgi:hypothetical protein